MRDAVRETGDKSPFLSIKKKRMMNSSPHSTSATPPWLREGGLDDIQPLNTSAQRQPSVQSLKGSADSERNLMPVHYALKFTTILLCMLMITTAVIGLGKLCALFFRSRDRASCLSCHSILIISPFLPLLHRIYSWRRSCGQDLCSGVHVIFFYFTTDL
jgi:hypothetical protein